MSVTFSKYYSELESDMRERYDEKLRLLKASEDLYCLFKHRSWLSERRQRVLCMLNGSSRLTLHTLQYHWWILNP